MFRYLFFQCIDAQGKKYLITKTDDLKSNLDIDHSIILSDSAFLKDHIKETWLVECNRLSKDKAYMYMTLHIPIEEEFRKDKEYSSFLRQNFRNGIFLLNGVDPIKCTERELSIRSFKEEYGNDHIAYKIMIKEMLKQWKTEFTHLFHK